MCTIGFRHVQVMLLFLNAAILYINRLHVALTILAMIKQPQTKNKTKFMTFNWDELQKAYIISSFYVGYIIGQIPSGFLVSRYKVKATLLFCTLITGIITLLTPLCTSIGGWKMLCLLRATQGLFQSCHYPACQQHLAKWSPIDERSFLFCLASSGYACGAACAMVFGGLIAASPLGWPSVYYISAALSFIWCVLWLLFGANDFNKCKFISTAESVHIENSLRQSVDFGVKKLTIPWRKIFSSPPYWCVLVVRSAESFNLMIVFYYVPSYMEHVHKILLSDNALYSALPYFFQWGALYLLMFLGEWLMRRKMLTLTALRKCCNSCGIWLPALLGVSIGFTDEQQKLLAIVLFIMIATTSTATRIGVHANVLDLAPNHAAILTTLVNTPAIFFGIMAPLFVGLLVKDEENRDQWRFVFIVAAVVACSADVLFIIWGTAKEQTWNSIEIQTRNDDITKAIEVVNPAFEQKEM